MANEGYVQQCAAAVVLASDTSADLTLTAKADAVLTGLPAPPNSRQISGSVYQMKDNERLPFANVWVGWEPIMDTVLADTVTDSQGRYRLWSAKGSRRCSIRRAAGHVGSGLRHGGCRR